MNCRRCNTPDVPLREIDFNGRRIFQDYACVKCFAILEQNFRQSWSVFKGLLDMGVSEPSASDMVKHYISHDKDVVN
jgi:hypothetical protein